jgi:superoxide reductase
MKIYTKKDELDGALIEKHAPAISSPEKVKAGEEFEVSVIIGGIVPHPNLIEHHIKWIQIFAEIEGRPFNPVHVATFDLGPAIAEPKVKLKMKLDKTANIIAVAYCNLHGLWENATKISV